MKQIIKHEIYGEIIYEESALSGKKSISINGIEATKLDKNTFKIDNTKITLTGNLLTGANVIIDTETILLTPKLKWYEIALSILPFILNIIWGNSVALCEIIPVVGGAIGGAICGATIIINMYLIKNIKQIWLKVIVSIAVLAASFLICYLIALAILA